MHCYPSSPGKLVANLTYDVQECDLLTEQQIGPAVTRRKLMGRGKIHSIYILEYLTITSLLIY